MEELPRLIDEAQNAIYGDSNDAEHDALWAFVEWAINALKGAGMEDLVPPEPEFDW